jgi:hypothetical protein
MNLGEFYHASKDAVEQVLDALPRTALGHLYMDTGKGIQTLSRDQAKAAQAQLTKNRQEGQYQWLATQLPLVFDCLSRCNSAWWDIGQTTLTYHKLRQLVDANHLVHAAGHARRAPAACMRWAEFRGPGLANRLQTAIFGDSSGICKTRIRQQQTAAAEFGTFLLKTATP